MLGPFSVLADLLANLAVIYINISCRCLWVFQVYLKLREHGNACQSYTERIVFGSEMS